MYDYVTKIQCYDCVPRKASLCMLQTEKEEEQFMNSTIVALIVVVCKYVMKHQHKLIKLEFVW